MCRTILSCAVLVAFVLPASAQRYVPPPGSVAVLFSDFSGRGQQCRHVMDLSAHPFSGAVLDTGAMERRYGPCAVRRPDGLAGRYYFAVDAETILGLFSAKLAEHLGHPPDLEELHDFAAVNPSQALAMIGSGTAGGAKPATPAITALSSPGPGQVTIKWQTRKHDEFSVRIDCGATGSKTVSVVEPELLYHTRTVELDAGQGGSCAVSVVARLGNQWGDWSRPRTVTVVARGTAPPVEEPPPVIEPEPEPEPGPPACREAALRSCVAACLGGGGGQ